MTARLLLALLALLAAAGPARADPDTLWKIISGKCLPNEREHGRPAPCEVVDVTDGAVHGYVVLKDLIGETQYLVMPTAKITGIEDPAVLAPGAANYFADAWGERHFTIAAAKRALRRDELSLAVNSVYGRSQNQLHIHIDCVAPAVKAVVARHLAAIGDKWAVFPEPLAGHRYRAMRAAGEALDANPFILVADGIPGARAAMGKETVVVVGATLPDGKPGFVILDTTADIATGNRANGEELQDHDCALARE
ncbi:MAG TPA: CDP-diacylglycerol diphosphatase [Stellaceae bacterium]|nr:CDP-diacylglycerol diphosphatase [Stellaceae bacterium]